MDTGDAADKISHELRRVLDSMNADIDRIELLTAALVGFSRLVPAYEPAFQHLHAPSVHEFQMGSGRD